jgi:hypothetical protein
VENQCETTFLVVATPTELILRNGVSKDGPRPSWFETALKRLLTMRGWFP